VPVWRPCERRDVDSPPKEADTGDY